MNDCREIKKNNSSTPGGGIPDSCNLVALTADKPEPKLQIRSEQTVVSAEATDIHCDPCFSTSTEARPAKPNSQHDPSKLWINAGFLTYHPTDHSGQFNDLNYGLGLEYEKSKSFSFAAGEYRNSVRHNSYYGMVEYQPLHLGVVKAGVAAGAISGYPEMNHGKPFPAALPVVSIEERHAGVNFIYIPQVKGVVPALSMQLKFRF